MHPEFDPVKAGEILNTPPRFESSSAVDGRIGNQLSQTTDIHSARDFFQTSGGQAKLPEMSIDSGFSSDASFGNNSGFSGSDFSNWSATGTESAMAQPGSLSQGLAPGLEQGLTPGLEQGLMPGLEQGLTPGLEQGLMPGLEQGLMPGLEQGALAGAMPPGGEPISPRSNDLEDARIDRNRRRFLLRTHGLLLPCRWRSDGIARSDLMGGSRAKCVHNTGDGRNARLPDDAHNHGR